MIYDETKLETTPKLVLQNFITNCSTIQAPRKELRNSRRKSSNKQKNKLIHEYECHKSISVTNAPRQRECVKQLTMTLNV